MNLMLFFYEVGVEACCGSAFRMAGAVPRIGEMVTLREEDQEYEVLKVVWRFRTGETSVDIHLRRLL